MAENPRAMAFIPTGFTHYPEKRLSVGAQVNSPVPDSLFGASWSINTMMTFLQAQVPATYTDSVLQSMTANDMLFAMRHVVFGPAH